MVSVQLSFTIVHTVAVYILMTINCSPSRKKQPLVYSLKISVTFLYIGMS
jgi:hypothetical protein